MADLQRSLLSSSSRTTANGVGSFSHRGLKTTVAPIPSSASVSTRDHASPDELNLSGNTVAPQRLLSPVNAEAGPSFLNMLSAGTSVMFRGIEIARAAQTEARG